MDPEAEDTAIDLSTGIDELKRRLEILLGQKPAAALYESGRAEVEREAAALQRGSRIQSAGGQLLGAAFALKISSLFDIQNVSRSGKGTYRHSIKGKKAKGGFFPLG